MIENATFPYKPALSKVNVGRLSIKMEDNSTQTYHFAYRTYENL